MCFSLLVRVSSRGGSAAGRSAPKLVLPSGRIPISSIGLRAGAECQPEFRAETQLQKRHPDPDSDHNPEPKGPAAKPPGLGGRIEEYRKRDADYFKSMIFRVLIPSSVLNRIR